MSAEEDGTKSPFDIAIEMQHKDLALKVVQLQQDLDAVTAENTEIKKKLVKAFDVISTDIGARKKLSIMAKSIYTAEDLDTKSLKELDEILEHISKVKKPFKAIADQSTGESVPTMDGLFAPWKNK